MAKYKVLVVMTKKVGTASRWVTVEAVNELAAIRIAEGKVKSPPSTVITVTATEVRLIK
jgi:hypothetical protein